MVDMKTPGVTVRPLVNMADRHGFNEVFFEDVRVPAKQVVGEVNRGWYHMAVALDFERSGIGSFAGGRKTVERLTDVAKANPELIAQRPSVRIELADRAIEVNVGTFLAYRVATMQAKGMVPNHEASASKLFGSEMGQRIATHRHASARHAGQLRDGSKHADRRPGARATSLPSPRTVAAGHERDPARHHRDARPRPPARLNRAVKYQAANARLNQPGVLLWLAADVTPRHRLQEEVRWLREPAIRGGAVESPLPIGSRPSRTLVSIASFKANRPSARSPYNVYFLSTTKMLTASFYFLEWRT